VSELLAENVIDPFNEHCLDRLESRRSR
jgi:hypothetical protein